MKRAGRTAAVVALLLLLLCVTTAWGSEAELYFSADGNGENRVTKVREGEQIWIVVYDPDEDIDCDVRDKVWTDIKVFDAKTGAHIVWKSYKSAAGDANDHPFGHDEYVPHKGHWPGKTAGWLGADYLEETEKSAGLFVSSRPFQIGTRIKFSHDGRDHAHIVGPYEKNGDAVMPTDFQWGGYLYAAADDVPEEGIGDDRVWISAIPAPAPAVGKAVPQFVDALITPTPPGSAYLPNGDPSATRGDYMLGRFENMDTIVGLYVDQNDPSDVALALAKIEDTEAEISWSEVIYRDGNEAATVRVVDPDENLNRGAVEKVPVFIIVNPGSWNWQDEPTSASDFWGLNRWGGVAEIPGLPGGIAPSAEQALLWCNIYDSGFTTADVDLRGDGSRQPNVDGTYYIQYPREEHGLPVAFDTDSDSGVTRVMFYATETGADTGVFELRLNSILRDLGFRTLNVRDVLAAYYLDPNDQDDFKLSLAYISERQHSSLHFTDYARKSQSLFWLGRDPVYIEVVDENANQDACCPERVVVQVCDPHEVDDTEWLILDELTSNSSIFFTHAGMKLVSVWDALGVGDPGTHGGYSLELDNWSLEAFNEDSIYVRYNDVRYSEVAMAGLGDRSIETSFPPEIEAIRVANDVAFSVFEVGDTQVYDGSTVQMYFLDRNGNRVTGYGNSDCVFIEVVDPDQNEDVLRRERVAAFWDGTAGEGQNIPHGPIDYPANHDGDCGWLDVETHMVNELLGDTNIFGTGTWGKIYILNPRNGRWASSDLFETGANTGDFVSVTCVDLVSQYECAPSLGVLPGDTILAAYQDPSNHSDIAWIALKVSAGGAQPLEVSTTRFVDETGTPVAAYIEGDLIYVRVDDPSLVGAGTVPDAVTIDAVKYSLGLLSGADPSAFITAGLDLGYRAGQTIMASYVDPTNPDDVSSATIAVVAGEFLVTGFFATPNPFADHVTFAYEGQGMAEEFAVSLYDLAGHLIRSVEDGDVLSIDWDGRNERGQSVANGAYLYVVTASAGEKRFSAKGIVFVNR